MALVQPDFLAISQHGRSPEIIPYAEVNHCSEKSSKRCNDHSRPKIHAMLVHEESGERKNDLAGNGKRCAFKSHQHEDSSISPLRQQAQCDTEYRVVKAQDALASWKKGVSNPLGFGITEPREPDRWQRLLSGLYRVIVFSAV